MPTAPFEQALPNSAEAERALLGGVLLNNRLIDQLTTLTKPDDFYVPSHRRIFCAMIELHRTNQPIDVILIGDILRKENHLQSVGGISFITNLSYGLPHSADLAYYARVVREKSALRWAMKEGAALSSACVAEGDDAVTILSRAIERLSDMRETLAIRGQTGGPLIELTKAVEDHLYRIKAGINPAVSTGLSVLDNLTGGGIPPGELWGIGALSSKGKSSLLVQILRHIACEGQSVILFSLEMKALSIALRLLAGDTSIPMSQIKAGLKDSEIDYLIERAKTIFNIPLEIYTDCRSVADIRNRLRIVKRQRDIRAVGIDYYGLLSGYGGGRDRYENRTQELKYIAAALQQQIAIDENVGVLVPAQFNRSGWSETDPGPANIDGGEAFFQACDLYATLGVETSKPGEKTAKAHLSVWKQRNGPTATGKERLNLVFHREKMQFFPRLEDEGEVVEDETPPDPTTEAGRKKYL